MVSSADLSFAKQALLGASLVALAIFAVQLSHIRAFAGKEHPTIIVNPVEFTYRLPGEYLKEGKPIFAPLERRKLGYSLEVMQYQVTRREYRECQRDNMCSAPLEDYTRLDGSEREEDWDLPVTGVSYYDAFNYAKWYAQKTGKNWRLPSDLEWAALAGRRYYDDALHKPGDKVDPTISIPEWSAYSDPNYEVGMNPNADPMPKQAGHFGKNKFGIYDLSGNVWEWTNACYHRYRLDKNGKIIKDLENCGVRAAQGKQRAFLTDFLQDPLSGECSISEPPDNIGIRLIRTIKD